MSGVLSPPGMARHAYGAFPANCFEKREGVRFLHHAR